MDINKLGWNVMEEESGPLGLTGIWNWPAELWLRYYTVAFTSNIRFCLETSLKRKNIKKQKELFCVLLACIEVSINLVMIKIITNCIPLCMLLYNLTRQFCQFSFGIKPTVIFLFIHEHFNSHRGGQQSISLFNTNIFCRRKIHKE